MRSRRVFYYLSLDEIDDWRFSPILSRIGPYIHLAFAAPSDMGGAPGGKKGEKKEAPKKKKFEAKPLTRCVKQLA